MNKKQIIRTLAAHAADAVVLLEKIWPDDAFPAKLCDRVDASDYSSRTRCCDRQRPARAVSRRAGRCGRHFRPPMCIRVGKL